MGFKVSVLNHTTALPPWVCGWTMGCPDPNAAFPFVHIRGADLSGSRN